MIVVYAPTGGKVMNCVVDFLNIVYAHLRELREKFQQDASCNLCVVTRTMVVKITKVKPLALHRPAYDDAHAVKALVQASGYQ